MAASIWPDDGGGAVIARSGVQKPPHSKRIRKAMRRLTRICMIAACGLALAAPGASADARPISLRDILGHAHIETRRTPDPPPIARYAPDDGGAFVLDRSVSPPLLRFEASQEIWVLQPQPGPRGDIIYKNDLGEPMLRFTRLGGLTLFTINRPDGAAAAFDSEAPPLRPAPILTPGALLQRLAQASARASRAAQRLVVFDAPDVTQASASLFADAAMVTSDAIVAVGRKGDPRHGLAKLGKVLLVPGRKPSASYNEGVLQVIIQAQQGVAGRPSSRRIEVVLLGVAP